MTDFTDSNSPEYQAAYEAEMKRLEAGEQPSTTAKAESVAEPAASTTSEGEQQTKTEGEQPDRFAELEAKLARQEKALKDTQRAMHQKAQELADLKRQREAEVRAANKPPVLDANPGLEDAIRYVAQPQATAEPSPQELDQLWFASVSGAIPDIDTLLADKDFEKAAHAKREELGADEWKNPVVAIRELNAIARRFAVEKATAAAKADYAKQQKELSTMRVSGGSGRDPATSDRVNGKTAEDVWAMNSKDFEAERRRVLGGYSF